LKAVKRFSTVRRAKKGNKVDKSAKNVDNHAFLCKSMGIKKDPNTHSWLSTISGDNFSTLSTGSANYPQKVGISYTHASGVVDNL